MAVPKPPILTEFGTHGEFWVALYLKAHNMYNLFQYLLVFLGGLMDNNHLLTKVITLAYKCILYLTLLESSNEVFLLI